MNPQKKRSEHLRVIWVFGAMSSLVCGVLAGLLRAGFSVPLASTHPLDHGAFMVIGFLLTLISLERAVALNRWWSYSAPAFALLATASSGLGYGIIHAGLALGSSLVLTVILIQFWARHHDEHEAVLILGALSAVFASGIHFMSSFVVSAPVWMSFLGLTIFGERLELSRVMAHQSSRWRKILGWGSVGVFTGGSLLATLGFDHRLQGAGMILMSAWIVVYDVARSILRRGAGAPPLARYMAVCLLSGSGWLFCTGVFFQFTSGGPLEVGLFYDALLHSFFLGFVFSMIFAHAPVIFPALFRKEIPFRPRFYLHWLILQLSLLLRVGGDFMYSMDIRKWGALINAFALVVFILNMLISVIQGSRKSGAKSGT